MKSYTKKSMINKLAKVFKKYNFFNDNLPIDGNYTMLSEVYNALPLEVKEKIQFLISKGLV